MSHDNASTKHSLGTVLPDSPDSGMDLHLLLNAVFTALVTSANARKKMRLYGISQRLQGEAPGWYLWRDDEPGAFLLELAAEEYRAGRPHGVFSLKYYPALENDPTFDSLSVYEQSMRLGDFFDDSGAPFFDKELLIPAEFFVVAAMKLEFDKRTGLLSLECSAQDFWPVRLLSDLSATGPDGETVTLVKAGGLGRNFPGWEKAWKIYDTLITAIGLYFKKAPLSVALTGRPGALYEQDGEELRAVNDADNTLHTSVCFFVPAEIAEKMLAPSDYDPYSLLDDWLAARGMGDGELAWLLVQPPTELFPYVNPEWWVATAEGDLSDIGLCCLLGHDRENMHK